LKKFTDASDKEIWEDLKHCSSSNAEINLSYFDGRAFADKIIESAIKKTISQQRPPLAKPQQDPQEALYDAVYGDKWCCNAARRFKRIESKEIGIKMRCNFCPRCGKYLGD
jgi:hypothetical protein